MVEKTVATNRLRLILPKPPPKTAIFFDERFMAARHGEGCSETNISMYFLVCEGLSNDGVGVAKGIVFQ